MSNLIASKYSKAKAAPITKGGGAAHGHKAKVLPMGLNSNMPNSLTNLQFLQPNNIVPAAANQVIGTLTAQQFYTQVGTELGVIYVTQVAPQSGTPSTGAVLPAPKGVELPRSAAAASGPVVTLPQAQCVMPIGAAFLALIFDTYQASNSAIIGEGEAETYSNENEQLLAQTVASAAEGMQVNLTNITNGTINLLNSNLHNEITQTQGLLSDQVGSAIVGSGANIMLSISSANNAGEGAELNDVFDTMKMGSEDLTNASKAISPQDEALVSEIMPKDQQDAFNVIKANQKSLNEAAQKTISHNFNAKDYMAEKYPSADPNTAVPKTPNDPIFNKTTMDDMVNKAVKNKKFAQENLKPYADKIGDTTTEFAQLAKAHADANSGIDEATNNDTFNLYTDAYKGTGQVNPPAGANTGQIAVNDDGTVLNALNAPARKNVALTQLNTLRMKLQANDKAIRAGEPVSAEFEYTAEDRDFIANKMNGVDAPPSLDALIGATADLPAGVKGAMAPAATKESLAELSKDIFDGVQNEQHLTDPATINSVKGYISKVAVQARVTQSTATEFTRIAKIGSSKSLGITAYKDRTSTSGDKALARAKTAKAQTLSSLAMLESNSVLPAMSQVFQMLISNQQQTMGVANQTATNLLSLGQTSQQTIEGAETQTASTLLSGIAQTNEGLDQARSNTVSNEVQSANSAWTALAGIAAAI